MKPLRVGILGAGGIAAHPEAATLVACCGRDPANPRGDRRRALARLRLADLRPGRAPATAVCRPA